MGQYEAEVLEVNPNILVVLAPRRMDYAESTEATICVYDVPKNSCPHIVYSGTFVYKVGEDRESP